MHRSTSNPDRHRLDGSPPLPMLAEVLEEADRLRPSWAGMQIDLRLSGVPLNDEEDEDGLSKEEADKLKKAIATKDKELREANKKLGKLESKVEDFEEKLEEAVKAAGKGGKGGDEGDGSDERISKLEQRVEKAEAKAEAAEEKRVEAEQASTAIDVATRLNFRNPKRAIKQLDSDDLSDEDSIEQALEQLATEEPYMVSSKKQRNVEDKPKPKASKKTEKEDEGKKPKEGDEELVGKARIKQAYDEEENGSGDEGGEGESED